MSSAAAALKPKHACKACGKPFDPEEGQEICNDCQARRKVMWVIGLVLLLICFVALPMLVQLFNHRPQP